MLNLNKETINSLQSFLKDWRGLDASNYKDQNDFYKNVVIVYNQLFINNCVINSNPYYRLFLSFNTDEYGLATDSLIDNSIKFSFLNKEKQIYTNQLHQELINTINKVEEFINGNISSLAGLDMLDYLREEEHLTASTILDIIFYKNGINLNKYCLIYLIVFQTINIFIAYYHIKIYGGWLFRK